MNNSLHDTTDDTADDRERNNEEEPQEEGQGITEEEVVCVEGEEAPTLPDEELSSHQEDQVSRRQIQENVCDENVCGTVPLVNEPLL